MMRIQFWLQILLLSGTLLATNPPQRDPLAKVIPRVTHACIAEIARSSVKTDRGDRILEAELMPQKVLWGVLPAGVIRIRYVESAPRSPGPNGPSIYYAPYSGSGIELEAKAKERYICLFAREGTALRLLRFEPVAKEAAVLALWTRLKKRPL